MGSQVTTLRLTAKCSPGQHRRLDQILGWSAEMYNACLESWKGSYAWWKEHHPGVDEKFPRERNHSRYDLFKMFTQVRAEDPRWAGLDTRVGRGVICRFDRTRKAFYERCAKEGTKPGFPRFKSRHRWRSIEIPGASPSMVREPGEGGRWWRLAVKGVPSVRFADRGGRLRTALDEGTLVELRVVRTPLRVELHAVFRHAATPEPAGEPTNPVGMDKGLTHRLAFCDGTYGDARTIDDVTIRRYQRRLSRAKERLPNTCPQTSGPGQGAAQGSGESPGSRLPASPRPGHYLRRDSCRRPERCGTTPNPQILQENVRTAMVRPRPHIGTQSRESWCPL